MGLRPSGLAALEEERAVAPDGVLVEVVILIEAVHREDRELLAAAGVAADRHDQRVKCHHDILLMLAGALLLPGAARVEREDDQVPRARADQVLHTLLRVLVRRPGLDVPNAHPPGGHLLPDLRAEPVGVGEDQDVLHRRRRVVQQRAVQPPEVDATKAAVEGLPVHGLLQPLKVEAPEATVEGLPLHGLRVLDCRSAGGGVAADHIEILLLLLLGLRRELRHAVDGGPAPCIGRPGVVVGLAGDLVGLGRLELSQLGLHLSDAIASGKPPLLGLVQPLFQLLRDLTDLGLTLLHWLRPASVRARNEAPQQPRLSLHLRGLRLRRLLPVLRREVGRGGLELQHLLLLLQLLHEQGIED
mmetsp:Transcript_22603/g.71126  ORF Transcript_22603/g.71126 Transcript_22603/m.71126 type:complete len:358 (-) Transcript_22603:250-1323(-)